MALKDSLVYLQESYFFKYPIFVESSPSLFHSHLPFPQIISTVDSFSLWHSAVE